MIITQVCLRVAFDFHAMYKCHNWHSNCRDDHQSHCQWTECSFHYHKQLLTLFLRFCMWPRTGKWCVFTWVIRNSLREAHLGVCLGHTAVHQRCRYLLYLNVTSKGCSFPSSNDVSWRWNLIDFASRKKWQYVFAAPSQPREPSVMLNNHQK